MRPVLSNARLRHRADIIAAYGRVQRALRTPDWKLILYNANALRTRQLFHVKSDPLELRNRAAEPAHRGRLLELTSRLQNLLREAGDPEAPQFDFRH